MFYITEENEEIKKENEDLKEEVGQLLYQDATSLLNQTKPNYKKYVVHVIVSLFLNAM